MTANIQTFVIQSVASLIFVILIVSALAVGPVLSTPHPSEPATTAVQPQSPDVQEPVSQLNSSSSVVVPASNTPNITLTTTQQEQLAATAHPLSADSTQSSGVERILVVEAITDERLNQLRAANVSIRQRHGTQLQVAVPPQALSTLHTLSWIDSIREPAVIGQPTHGAESEGIESLGANNLHEQGITGEGVRVGIIDIGFEPTNEHIVDNIEEIRGDSTGRISHGTATAEVVTDVAPNSSLYLASISGELEYASAVDWLVAQDVDVIVMSLSFFGQPNDGTGFISEQATTAVQEHDVVWVNAAGNQRQSHYQAQFTDTNNNSFHNFPEAGDGNWLNGGDQIQAGSPLRVALTWNQWPTTATDYDMAVYRANTSGPDQLIARSTTSQTGIEEPVEIISLTAPTNGRYYLAVRNTDARGTETIELFAFAGGPLGVQTPESSLTAPAVGRNITTVAASNWDATETTYYSSMGPTNDGRVGVDVTGPTAVTNSVYGTYAGTSASAPHVGGVAALLKSTHPILRGSELRTIIQQSGGTVSPTLAAGYGATDTVRAADRADETAAISTTLTATTPQVKSGETTAIDIKVQNTRGIASYNFSVVAENTTRAHIENATTAGAPVGTNTTINSTHSSATVSVTNATITSNAAVTLGTATIRGNQSGSSNVTVTVSNITTADGYRYQPQSITSGQTLTVNNEIADITGNRLAPTDPDGDGRYEDVNGDGRVTISDVQALFEARNHEAVQANVAAFDFNGDNEASILDIQALFAKLTSSPR